MIFRIAVEHLVSDIGPTHERFIKQVGIPLCHSWCLMIKELLYGPGYRVYFGRVGEKLVLLICADPKGIRKKILNSLKNIGLIIKGENYGFRTPFYIMV